MFSQPNVTIREVGPRDYEITIEWERGIIRRLLNMKPRTAVYRGSDTVWHEYPSGDRVGVLLDSWLSDRVTAWKWQHEKTNS